MPHAYKWCGDSRLGVLPRRTGVLAMHACPEGVQALHALRTGMRPRRTGVLAMHACLEGVQALHALRTGVHGRHACPARLTVPSGTLIRAPRGSRKPLNSRGLREPGRKGVPAVHACLEGVQGLHALQTGVHGQHACPAGPHAKPAVLTPFVGVRTACGMRGFALLVGKACSPARLFF
ncbi:hypothetical protein PCASD_10010 [Puccinia coronata f. sp. avenae]|uniref:Uncharacterized protein n=1 Tax=Puccinia coronata f. sp. avenae TaxID=200324 RepID=A0A2N5UV75_9BASI|nr:hypothetical protein PCASD_10010 [Puccinia coronata f. sp. avenae]